MILIRLFYEFFRAGLFSIGGGLATLPFLQEISQRTNWFTTQDLLNLIAVSESTPGPIGVNAATYAGFRTEGVIGGITATLGLVAPSIIIIILVSKILERFKMCVLVQNIFYGLRPASTGLIASAGFTVMLSTLVKASAVTPMSAKTFNWFGIFMAVILYWLIQKYRKHPFFYIALSAAAGILAGGMHVI